MVSKDFDESSIYENKLNDIDVFDSAKVIFMIPISSQFLSYSNIENNLSNNNTHSTKISNFSS